MSGKRHNGEGSIRQRTDGLWEARLTLPDGRRKSFYDPSRQVVARRLAEALRDRDKGVALLTDERLTCAQYCAQWLERMQPPRERPTTHRRYTQQLAHVTRAYGDLRLTKLTAVQLATLYAQLQRPPTIPPPAPPEKPQRALSATSVHHIHVVLRHALGDAVKLGVLVANVTDRVDAPKLRACRSSHSTRMRRSGCWKPRKATAWRRCMWSQSPQVCGWASCWRSPDDR